jgi:acetyl-CoA carboxylase biotin carboxyl carrier protein
MNEREIKRLIRIVEESGIDELEVTRWGRSVRIVKRPTNGAEPPSGGAVIVNSTRSPAPAAAPLSAETSAAEPESASRPGIEVVRAPMVGTFYRAPSPEAPSYVEVGDRVRKGQTLCILEAMKLMNEIEAESEGLVRAVLAENGEPIEYGQPLFELELV